MVITGLVMVIATVPLFHAMAVWAVALEVHFGWSRAQLGLALTLTRVESGLIGPLEGYLVDKVGTRRMVLVGLLILGGAWVFFSRVENLWMFYVAYVLMAMGQGLGSWIPLMTMLNKWFARRRSSAIGWANVISRFGALVLIPGIAWAVADASGRPGWQTTALIVGIAILVLGLPPGQPHPQRPKGIRTVARWRAAATGRWGIGGRTRPVAAAGANRRRGPAHSGLLADRFRARVHLQWSSWPS